MAHFAKLGIDNIVLNVVVVADANTSTIGGIEKEDLIPTSISRCRW